MWHVEQMTRKFVLYIKSSKRWKENCVGGSLKRVNVCLSSLCTQFFSTTGGTLITESTNFHFINKLSGSEKLTHSSNRFGTQDKQPENHFVSKSPVHLLWISTAITKKITATQWTSFFMKEPSVSDIRSSAAAVRIPPEQCHLHTAVLKTIHCKLALIHQELSSGRVFIPYSQPSDCVTAGRAAFWLLSFVVLKLWLGKRL